MKNKLLVVASLCFTSFVAEAKMPKHTGELLFKIKETKSLAKTKALNSLYSKLGINNKTAYSNGIVNVFAPVQKSANVEQIKKEMEESGLFKFVEYNTYEHEIGKLSKSTALPSDPGISKQYHHDLMETAQAWNITQGEGVTVAVCDSGVDSQHEDLKGQVLKKGAWDFHDKDDHANPATSHGTFVAGLIASSSNKVGGVGVAPKAKILPLRITSTKGGTSLKTISDCIRYAADQGAKIINVSFTGIQKATIHESGKYAVKKGSLLVYAAGNAGRNKRWSDSKYIMAVGGSTAKDKLWRYKKCKFIICYTLGSNAGAFIDVVAPGHKLYSTSTYVELNQGSEKYGLNSGTSFSAPIVSGVAALVASVRPDLGPKQIEKIIERTAEKIGSGKEYFYGSGRVNAFQAVKLALEY